MKKKELFRDLSDEQAEKVVGGVGAGARPGAGINGWFGGPSAGTNGLINAGFSPGTAITKTLPSGVMVTVPGPKGG